MRIRWIDKARGAFVFACPSHPGTTGRGERPPGSNSYLARCPRGCRFSIPLKRSAESPSRARRATSAVNPNNARDAARKPSNGNAYATKTQVADFASEEAAGYGQQNADDGPESPGENHAASLNEYEVSDATTTPDDDSEPPSEDEYIGADSASASAGFDPSSDSENGATASRASRVGINPYAQADEAQASAESPGAMDDAGPQPRKARAYSNGQNNNGAGKASYERPPLTLRDLGERLKGTRWNGDTKLTGFCPSHDDQNQRSLSATVTDNGVILVKCFKGCSIDAICAALGIKIADLFPRNGSGRWYGRARNQQANQAQDRSRRSFLLSAKETRYRIFDEHGELAAIHVRLDGTESATGKPGKRTWWLRQDGTKSNSDVHAAALPLYGVHTLGEHPDETTIVICEGEKTCDSLTRRGIVAVGTVCGAGSIPSDVSLGPLLRFERIVLWPDKDPFDQKMGRKPGAYHMTQVALALRRMGHACLRWIEVPEAPENGFDAADFEGGQNEIEALIEKAIEPHFEQEGDADSAHVDSVPALEGFRTAKVYLAEMKEEVRSKRWYVGDPDKRRGLFQAGQCSGIVGRPWTGKSSGACTLTYCLLYGLPFLGYPIPEAVQVGYMALERNGSDVAELFERWGIDDRIAFLDRKPRTIENEHLPEYLHEQIIKHRLEFLVVDHLTNLVTIKNINDNSEVEEKLSPYNEVARDTGKHLCLLLYQGKHQGTGHSDQIDVLGAESLRGQFHSLFEAFKFGGDNHYLRGIVRHQLDFPRTRLQIDAVGKIYALADQNSAVEELVIKTLVAADDWLTERAIREHEPQLAAVPRSTLLWNINKSMLDKGLIKRGGKGGKGRPFRYATPEVALRNPQGSGDKEDQGKLL